MTNLVCVDTCPPLRCALSRLIARQLLGWGSRKSPKICGKRWTKTTAALPPSMNWTQRMPKCWPSSRPQQRDKLRCGASAYGWVKIQIPFFLGTPRFVWFILKGNLGGRGVRPTAILMSMGRFVLSLPEVWMTKKFGGVREADGCVEPRAVPVRRKWILS